MTPFEIISLILLWVIVGVWISYKRNWYKDLRNSHKYNRAVDRGDAIATNIMLAPLVLLIVLIFRLFVEPWEQN